jgi:nucleoside-diphosphate-sugar epimerase
VTRVVVWGAGELGAPIALRAAREGRPALAFTRSTDRHSALQAGGVVAHTGDAAPHVRPDDLLLLCVPGHEALTACVTALAQVGAKPARAVYISSTGYYGLASGRVDEETPPGLDTHAQSIAGGESLFRAWAGERGVVLRFGGLYKRGRGPLSALAKRGRPPLGPPDRTLSLLHYDDAVEATWCALHHPTPAPVYVGVVPPCPTRKDFYLAACVVLGLDLPGFDAALGLPLAVYDTRRFRTDLLPAPTHPRWQEALIP